MVGDANQVERSYPQRVENARDFTREVNQGVNECSASVPLARSRCQVLFSRIPLIFSGIYCCSPMPWHGL